MAASKATFFTWTDEEMECLLRLTIHYKAQKAMDNVDWESCVTKYSDILQLFSAEYPAASAGNQKGFPNKLEELTKTALTTKLKAVRVKYRHAVDSGRKSGHGRVVLLYFDFCEKIWGGSPATRALGSGIETTDIMDPDTAVS